MEYKYWMVLAIIFMSWLTVWAADLELAATNNYPVFKPEYTDIFHGKKPRIYLDGEWQSRVFFCSQNDYEKTVGTNSACFNGPGPGQGDAWKPILVPNYVDASYGSDKIGAMFLSRDFTVPEDAVGKRLILTFTGVAWSPIVYVNGRKADEYRSLLPGWITEFFQTDITPLIHPGSNVITVALFKFRKTQRLFSSGIYCPVYIDLVEPTYAANTLITPCLPDTINVKSTLMNTTDKTIKEEVTAVVENWKGEGQTITAKIGRQTLKPGANPLGFSMRIEKPVLWDVENPHLYSLKLFCGDKLVGWERFGLREFKVSGRDFILNGRKVNCFGIAAEEGNLVRMMYVQNINPQFLNNGGDCLRRYLTALKENNCNAAMRWPVFTEILNDLADEIGILQFHMILPWKMYTDDMPIWVKRQIVNKKKEVPEFFSRGYFYEQGAPDKKIQNAFANLTKYKSSFTALVAEGKARRCPPEIFDLEGRDAFLREAYEKLGARIRNHPAVVAILTGNEGFRDINQAFDMPVQKAALHATCPGMLFTAEHSYGATSTDLAGNQADATNMLSLLDFVNPATHGIGGSGMCAYPWPMFSHSLKYFSEEVYRRLNRELPIFADEIFYYGYLSFVCRPESWDPKNMELMRKTAAALFPNGQLDTAKMAALFSSPGLAATYAIANRHERAKYLREEQAKAKSEGDTWSSTRRIIQLMGLCPEIGDQNALLTAVANRTKKMVEPVRIADQYMQGLGATTGPWIEYDMERLAQLDAGGIKEVSPIGKMFKRVYAPVFVCLDFYGNRSSMLAGETFKTDLYLFNNSGSDLKDIKVKITLLGEKGEAFASEAAQPGLNSSGKATMPLQIPFDRNLPSGDYRIALSMAASGKVVAENAYELYVFNAAKAAEVVASPETVYVYESYDPETRETFRCFLDSLKLKAVYVPKENLLEVTYYNQKPDKIKHLILSPRSIDHTNTDNLAELKPWLEKGGRLLCFEQDYAGAMPWAPEFSWVRLRRKMDYALPAIGADLIPVRYEDPLFQGIGKRQYWESFNNPDGEMYRYLIAPLTADAKLIGTDVGQLYPAIFGVLNVDWKIGEGRCVISQVEAVKALNHQDGVARKYLINLVGGWLKQ